MRSKIIKLTLIFNLLVFHLSAQETEPTYTISLNKDLSSPEADYSPRIIKDKKILMFTSQRAYFNGYENSNLYYSLFGNGKWNAPNSFIKGTQPSNNGTITIDKKRNVLFFTKCPIIKNVNSKCGIYFAFMKGGMMGEAILLDIPMDVDKSKYNTGHPYFSNELDILFFASTMPGGYGSTDIWYSKYDRNNDSWSKPKNLGPEINTKGSETFPFIKADGTLYFSSTEHNSLGKDDIFKASKINGELKWEKVVNLKEPINSPYEESGIVFNEDSESGFFSSNRPGGSGKDDIYEFSSNINSPIVKADSSQNQSQEIKDIYTALTALYNKQDCTPNTEPLNISNSKVFPNPNNGQFTVEFNCNKKTNLKVRIYSSNGAVLNIEELQVEKGKFIKEYQFQKIEKGIYYVSVLHDCEILNTTKIIIE